MQEFTNEQSNYCLDDISYELEQVFLHSLPGFINIIYVQYLVIYNLILQVNQNWSNKYSTKIFYCQYLSKR